ncbi:BTB/POZ domain-containing protein, partial [Colletotrichum scovillei]
IAFIVRERGLWVLSFFTKRLIIIKDRIFEYSFYAYEAFLELFLNKEPILPPPASTLPSATVLA